MNFLKNEKLLNLADLGGRILISLIFLLSGLMKIFQYEATKGFMEAMGTPGILLPLVILTEVGGSLAIIFGFHTRIAAILLAGFSIISALIFHANFADQVQMIMFLKNFAMAGGFLIIYSKGAGRYSLDAKKGRW